MSHVTRRNILQAAGVVGTTMASARFAAGQAGADQQKPPARRLLDQLRLSDQQRRQYKLFSSPDQIPVSGDDLPKVKLEVAKVDALVEEVKDGKGRPLALALRWTCESNVLNDLHVDGQPLQARTFTFGVVNISWKAGGGWPVYHDYCPRDDYGDTYYRHAKAHQIVPSIVGVNYFVGCLSSATCTGSRSGQVRFAVNDGAGDYGDNQGTFEVIIYSYS